MTKVISVSDEAYDLLQLQKMAGESFSKVIVRTLKNNKDIMNFAGIWKDSKGWDKILAEMYEDRKKFGKGRNVHF